MREVHWHQATDRLPARRRLGTPPGLGREASSSTAEQACALGQEALTIADPISSGRVYRRLADLHRESTRFKTNPTVAEFRDELYHRLRHAAVTT